MRHKKKSTLTKRAVTNGCWLPLRLRWRGLKVKARSHRGRNFRKSKLGRECDYAFLEATLLHQNRQKHLCLR